MFGGVTFGEHYRNGLESGLMPESARPYIKEFISLESQLNNVQAQIESLKMAQKVSLSAVTAIKIAALEKNIEEIHFQLLGVTENINREIFAFRDNSITHTLVVEKENLEAQLGAIKNKLQHLMACKENEKNPKKIEILNAVIKDSFQKKIPLVRKLISVLEELDADKFKKQLEKSRKVYSDIYDSLGDEAGLPERLKDKSNNINLKETIKRLQAGLEIEVNYLRSISQSQNTRKTTIRHLLQNPEKLIRAMIDERSKDPEYKRRLEEELLEAELAAPRKAKVVKGKKKSNKNKGGGAKPAKAAAREEASAALPKISAKERAIANVYKQGEIGPGQIKMHPSMKQWEQPDLTDISTWPKYAELNKTEQREQIIAHTVGIGAERLLNDPALRGEYVWDTERGPMMSCLVKLKDGEELYGKLHFVVDEKNRVFHRMFFQAKPEYSMEEFLLERGEVVVPGEAAGSSALTEEETMVGRYSFELHADQRMEYTLANNAFVESYTIFSFNK